MNNPYSRALFTAKYRLMVVSAKGGVGKSTTTVNLAAALAARGKKVGIFDADLHGPNIPALLGISQKKRLSSKVDPEDMVPIEARPDSLDMRPLKPLERYNLNIMSLGLLVSEQQILNPLPETVGLIIRQLLARIDWGGCDIVLIDMPPGTGEPLTTLLRERLVDGILLITLRQRLSHLDNGRLVNLIASTTVPALGVIENMTHVLCPRCGQLIELYPSSANDQPIYADIPTIGAIPFHPELIREIRSGPPLPLAEPDIPIAAPFLRLADEVITRIATSKG